MEFLLFFLLIWVLVFVLIAVHEAGHYLAGWMGGIPARNMRVVLFAFPQHVALRDGEEWVSPIQDIQRYITITQRYFGSYWTAFAWVAGGMVVELVFVTCVWSAALYMGYRAVGFWTACVSLSMYAINIGLMDLPWALRYRCAVGDTSGLWQIARLPAVIFSIVMATSRILLVMFSA